MHEKHDELIGDDYQILPFRDLPKPYQMAIAWYMAANGEAWTDVDYLGDAEPPPRPYETMPHAEWEKLSRDEQSRLANEWHRSWDATVKERIEAALPEFCEHYGDVPFGVASIPTEAAKASVMQGEDVVSDWDGDWDRYHAWYIGHSDMPDHGRTDRWPCVMSSYETETFQDGWHRFHSYCRAGDADIPVVFYPAQRHLDAKLSAPALG